MDYKRIKKLDFKKWLLGGNARIYAFILVLFLAAVVFMFTTVESMFNPQQDNSTTEAATDETESSSSYIADNQSYMISINKSQNFVTIYKMNAEKEFTNVYKVFRCSVNANVPTGETTITDKSIWRKLETNVYGHYTSKLDNSCYIHSVPFSSQDSSKLIVSAYNRLGKSAQTGSIYLTSADAKWIYENCGLNTTVKIYEDATEIPSIALGEFETVSSGTSFDPTDETSTKNDTVSNTKINYMTGVDDCTIGLNQSFDKWKGIYAVDINGKDLTSYITVSGDVDTTTEGTYTLIYSISDNFGTHLAYYRYVTVTKVASSSGNSTGNSSTGNTSSNSATSGTTGNSGTSTTGIPSSGTTGGDNSSTSAATTASSPKGSS